MKFSYFLIKKLGTRIPEKPKLIEGLNLHAFETVDLGGDSLEISVPANRYSDAASHYGMAVVASAIAGKKAGSLKLPSLKLRPKSVKVKINVVSKKLCPRYSGLYAEVKKIEPSPKWLQEILIACGLRPINNVVDVMNYVMLEVGQPMHAFDAEKIEGTINVRMAASGERILTIDGVEYKLSSQDLVIADDKSLLAVAGIKGGKKAEVMGRTRKLIVEAANFDSVSIYKTARYLNLFTDASARFSHGLSPVLVERGIKRAAALLKDVCGAKVGDWVDFNLRKPSKTVVKFDIAKFNQLTGLNLKEKDCFGYLKNLGFGIKGKLVEAPAERLDVSIMEDLAEEIVNLSGYDDLPAAVPNIRLIPSGAEDGITLKDVIRSVLSGFGLSEVYNYSFVSRQAALTSAEIWNGKPIALRNPISSDWQYLRPSLQPHLLKNLEENLRFYDTVRIFEIGKVFPSDNQEVAALGVALASKKGDVFLELKGLADSLLRGVGLTDFAMVPYGNGLRIESDHSVVGYLKTAGGVKSKAGAVFAAAAEIDLDKLAKLAVEEKEYRPLPKYPSVVRDLSIILPNNQRVGPVQDVIENASHLLDDVDLIDWYQDEQMGDDKKSLTWRLVFQAEDRTLTDEEVGREVEKIVTALRQNFEVEVR